MIQYTKGKKLLAVQNVGLSFSSKVVLQNVSFDVYDVLRPGVVQGQVVSLIGRSGIGKSQMLRILSGLHIKGATLTGNILVGLDQKPVKAGDMGVVPQDYYLPKHLKLKQMFMLAAKKNALLVDAKVREEAVAWYANAFDLTEHLDKYASIPPLSGGQLQRASIATQLLAGSNFLLMDEPFSGLDPISIDKTTNLLLKISQQDELKTIIIVSHDLPSCVAISDSVFVLSAKGRSPQEGATMAREINLIERGLAWQPDIKNTSSFLDTIKEIKELL